jgi:hypothetical protein
MKIDCYTIPSKLWIYPGDGGWHFATVSRTDMLAIKDRYNPVKKGWGSIPVEATIGSTSWKTSLFPGKDGTYLIPVKALVRKSENIVDGDAIEISLRVIE